MMTFEIGKPFPDPRYAVPGDQLRPIFTNDSLAILQALTDLTPNEIEACASETIEISLFTYKQVPFLYFIIGGVLGGEIALNIKKMDPNRVDFWLRSENDTVTIFLLEGNDTTLQNIRYFQLPFMKRIRNILMVQNFMTDEEIEAYTDEAREKFSPAQWNTWQKIIVLSQA